MVEEDYKSDVFAERLKELRLEKGIGQNKREQYLHELGINRYWILYELFADIRNHADWIVAYKEEPARAGQQQQRAMNERRAQ